MHCCFKLIASNTKQVDPSNSTSAFRLQLIGQGLEIVLLEKDKSPDEGLAHRCNASDCVPLCARVYLRFHLVVPSDCQHWLLVF
ncbi:hypothetical protein XELAEV_18003555mg [Xenopus laevis]|nr:hypothetical protein XELAEV_18003555mg [Xenopus laevis]